MRSPGPDIMHSSALVVCRTAADACRWAARRLAERIAAERRIVLGLATGNTQREVYEILVAQRREGHLSLAGVTSFNLDEYVGLPPDHPSSFAAYMNRFLFSSTDIDPARTHLPDGSAADLDAAAATYERRIAEAGGIDVQLLGIGRNGHIGFNEPGSPEDGRTRVVELTESTIAANTRDFPPGETPPGRAVTMGIGTILEAREILLLATGAEKAEAVARAFHGRIDRDSPASFLRLHPATTWVCDGDAAARLGVGWSCLSEGTRDHAAA
jgi:glucosamine-6-phosphate deaminase